MPLLLFYIPFIIPPPPFHLLFLSPFPQFLGLSEGSTVHKQPAYSQRIVQEPVFFFYVIMRQAPKGRN